ncbi:MAG: glycosyltransferase family 2 protein [Oceanihabitans sp.]
MVLLSVHVLTYNSEQFIEQTLLSILKQETNFNFEIVVGDDCSTDNTLEIVKRYALKHPEKFRVEKNKNQLGILKNFKATLDRCEGKYVFDIAGDDQLKTTNALQLMVDALQANTNIGFVDSGYDILNCNTNKTNYFVNKSNINVSKEAYKNRVLLGNIIPIGICYNKALLNKYVDFNYYIEKNITIEDYPILVNLIMNTEFTRIDKSLHTYLIHYHSYSHQINFKKLQFLKTQMLNLFNDFNEKYGFSNTINNSYLESHYKHQLFIASYFKKKALAKKAFNKIKNKGVFDYVHLGICLFPVPFSRIILNKRKKIYIY